jgi:hypothetical protein
MPVLALLGVLSFPSFAAEPPTLDVRVVDAQGHPVAWANVTVRCDHAQNRFRQARTDGDGRFTVRENVVDTCRIYVEGMREIAISVETVRHFRTLQLEEAEETTFSKDFLARVPASSAYSGSYPVPSALTPDLVDGRRLVHPHYLDLPAGCGCVHGLSAANLSVPPIPPALHQVSLEHIPVERFDDALALVPGVLRTSSGAWVDADGGAPTQLYVDGVRRDR